VDVDAFVLTHRGTWDRLDQLIKRRRSLTGAEIDELVELYQRVSTHLSMLRSASTIGSDSLLIGRLSSLIARARAAVTGAHAPLSGAFTRFWTVSFPVVAYRGWRWWLATAVAFFGLVLVIAFWVAGNPEVQSVIGTPTDIDELVNHDVASYYSEHPAPAFALQVWVKTWFRPGASRYPLCWDCRSRLCCSRTRPTADGLMFEPEGRNPAGSAGPHGY
jgi:hypothetical protein